MSTTRARLRQTAINTLHEHEIRDLVAILHAKIDGGIAVTEDEFEDSLRVVFETRDGDDAPDVERVDPA